MELRAEQRLTRVVESESLKRCPYCHDALGERQPWRCQACATEHHFECASIHKGCAVYGCGRQGRGPSAFFSDLSTSTLEEWTPARKLATAIWLSVVLCGAIGFVFFIQWLLETPTEFTIAELVIISVR